MSLVRAQAPCRVDLAGGTLDLWPTNQLVADACTINAAIAVRTGCEIELGGSTWRFLAKDSGEQLELDALPERPETDLPAAFTLAGLAIAHFELPPCRVETFSEAPRGSGLGGSSSLMVALLEACAALTSWTHEASELVELAANLETRVLRLPAGTQDHVGAWYGGLSLIRHGACGWERIALDEVRVELADRLIVADSRVPHHSGMSNWSVLRRFLDGDAATRDALEGVAASARSMREAMLSGARGDALSEAVCLTMAEDWKARRSLGESVSTPELARLIEAVEDAGGRAKVCGAGGGGCIVALPLSADRKAAVQAALKATGAALMEAPIVSEGVRVELA